EKPWPACRSAPRGSRGSPTRVCEPASTRNVPPRRAPGPALEPTWEGIMIQLLGGERAWRLACRAAALGVAAGVALGSGPAAFAAPAAPTSTTTVPTGPGLPSVVSMGTTGQVLMAVNGTSVGVRTVNAAVSPVTVGTKELPGGGVYGAPAIVR